MKTLEIKVNANGYSYIVDGEVKVEFKKNSTGAESVGVNIEDDSRIADDDYYTLRNLEDELYRTMREMED
jgi:hypothetical protein